MTYQVPFAVQVQKFIPATGATVNVSASDANVIVVMLNNTGLLASLTINLPTAAFGGQLVRCTFNGAITVVTWTGVSQLGGITAALANGYIAFVYDDTNSTWRRCA